MQTSSVHSRRLGLADPGARTPRGSAPTAGGRAAPVARAGGHDRRPDRPPQTMWSAAAGSRPGPAPSQNRGQPPGLGPAQRARRSSASSAVPTTSRTSPGRPGAAAASQPSPARRHPPPAGPACPRSPGGRTRRPRGGRGRATGARRTTWWRRRRTAGPASSAAPARSLRPGTSVPRSGCVGPSAAPSTPPHLAGQRAARPRPPGPRARPPSLGGTTRWVRTGKSGARARPGPAARAGRSGTPRPLSATRSSAGPGPEPRRPCRRSSWATARWKPAAIGPAGRPARRSATMARSTGPGSIWSPRRRRTGTAGPVPSSAAATASSSMAAWAS